MSTICRSTLFSRTRHNGACSHEERTRLALQHFDRLCARIFGPSTAAQSSGEEEKNRASDNIPFDATDTTTVAHSWTRSFCENTHRCPPSSFGTTGGTERTCKPRAAVRVEGLSQLLRSEFTAEPGRSFSSFLFAHCCTAERRSMSNRS